MNGSFCATFLYEETLLPTSEKNKMICKMQYIIDCLLDNTFPYYFSHFIEYDNMNIWLL